MARTLLTNLKINLKPTQKMKQIIWTDNITIDDEAREQYEKEQQEWNDDPEYTVSDAEWYDNCNMWFSDVYGNLDQEVDGVIIAFASVQVWTGLHQGFKILGSNVKDIFKCSEDSNEYWGDGYNIRGRHAHHDGAHRTLFRVAKDRDTAERIARQIYLGKMDEKSFRRHTKSLYPYVADIYGWSTKRFRKPSKQAV